MARTARSILRRSRGVVYLALAIWMACGLASVRGELPAPDLRTVFPTGGRVGSSIEVAIEGGQLDGTTSLRLSDPRLRTVPLGSNKFQLTIPPDVRPGVYDLRVIGKYGVSAPRTFVISSLTDLLETEPNDLPDQAASAGLEQAIHGKLDRPGDVDNFRFTARRGQRVTVDLWAERVDSPLQGVLEIFDAAGHRLVVNRGGTRRDPAIDFVAPADGDYRVRLCDQTLVGGAAYLYRLQLSTTPHIEGTAPLTEPRADATGSATVEELTHDRAERGFPISLRLADVPVVREASDNHGLELAQPLTVPCQVAGTLAAGDEQDWFRVVARKGEVLWIETFGARIGSPVDLDVVVVDSEQRELARLSDQVENLGGARFSTNHTDAEGRFVAPADGSYWLMVRNLIGDLATDPRRVYRLTVRREEPDFQLVALPRRADQPTALNVWRGGREIVEVLVDRRRGMREPIRIAAENLPAGFECPDVWIGPGERRAIVVVSADRGMPESIGTLQLIGRANVGGSEVQRAVRATSMVRANTPQGWGRLTADLPVAAVQDAQLILHAAIVQSTCFQGSIVDVAINVDRRDGATAALQISGVGLPGAMDNALQVIPAGETSGWLSFFIPESLPPGPYSFAIQAETDAVVNGQKTPVVTFSNPLLIQVDPGRIHVSVDPRTPRKIARGQVIHVKYRAERQHGFIGKIHTELAAPGGVTGIRGRGVTFTGLTEAGDIQVIATENAEPGQVLFLRLEAVGTVEDQPVFRGSRFLELEITK